MSVMLTFANCQIDQVEMAFTMASFTEFLSISPDLGYL